MKTVQLENKMAVEIRQMGDKEAGRVIPQVKEGT